MTTMEQQQQVLDEALGDFAQKRGQIYLEQIKASAGGSLRDQGQHIAIDAMTGQYLLADTLGGAMDAFQQRFGDRAVAWLVDLDA